MLLLTVDWDWFWNEPADIDWGHREGGPFFENLIWSVRSVGAGMSGISLREVMSKDVDPRPDGFWEKLVKLGFDLQSAKLTISDSHMYAAQAFAPVLGALSVGSRRIVNIDAHHDLGYGSPKIRKMWDEGKVEAGGWLGFLIRVMGCSADIVYPSWKGLRERIPRTKEARRAEVRVFGQGDPVPGGSVLALHVARSPAWSPPWGDDGFRSFVKEAESMTGWKAEVLGDSDPRKVRRFSEPVVDSSILKNLENLHGQGA